MRFDERLPRSHRLAIDDGVRAWRFDELHTEAQRRADELAARGLRRGDAFGWLGANSVILPGVHLGKNSVVAAGTVVRPGRYPDHAVIAGVPGKVVRTHDPELGWDPPLRETGTPTRVPTPVTGLPPEVPAEPPEPGSPTRFPPA